MTTLKAARVAAVRLSVGTFMSLFPTGSWRADNPFLLPDLALCAALLVTASLRGHTAASALLAASCFAAGVLATAAMSYVVAGRIGIGSLIGAVGSLAVAALLLRTVSVTSA